MMRVLCIVLMLAAIGLNASPIEEVKVSKTNFGEAVNYRLKILKDALSCYYHGNISLIPGLFAESPKHISNLNDKDSRNYFDFNITHLELIGIDKFEILKSEYNESTKKFELDIKFHESYLQGHVQSNTTSYFTYLGFYFNGNLDFNLRMLPSIFKLDWTFFIDDEIEHLEIKDFHASVELIDPAMNKPTNLEEFFHGAPKEMYELRDATLNLFAELREALKTIILQGAEDVVSQELRGFSSVNAIAEAITHIEPSSKLSKIFECLEKL